MGVEEYLQGILLVFLKVHSNWIVEAALFQLAQEKINITTY